jgi:RecA/RadA recombinase
MESASTLNIAVEKLSFGCEILDEAFGGEGLTVNNGHVVEIVGEASCGKSHLAFQLAVQMFLQYSAQTVFLSTESPFSINRLLEIFKLTVERATESALEADIQLQAFQKMLLIKDIANSSALMKCFDVELGALLNAKPNLKLIVLDSIAGVLRDSSEFANSFVKSAFIFKLGAKMKQIAAKYNVLLVVVNQISDLTDEESALLRTAWTRGSVHHTSKGIPTVWSTSRWVIPALGNSWSYCVNVRLFLTRISSSLRSTVRENDDEPSAPSRRRRLFVVTCPYAPTSSVDFIIAEDGVEGIR